MAEPKSKMENWADVEDDDPVQTVTKKMNETEIPKEETKDEDEPTYIPKEDIGSTDRKSKVEVDNVDPNDPLFSVRSFEELGLSDELKRGVYAMGFKKPSKIQEKALPLILKGQNLIAQAQSGTGKTAAFSLGMLSHCNPAEKYPQVLCISPARELAGQTFEVIKKMGQFTSLEFQLIVPDHPMPDVVKAQVIVGTPGKVADAFKKAINPKKITMFVVDEADQMIEEGTLGTQTQNIKKALNPKRQILLFSATYAPKVRTYAEKMVPQPCAQIRLKAKQLSLEGIIQLKIFCKDEKEKFDVLMEIYGYLTVGQSIIFVHTRKTAIELAARIKKEGYPVGLIHGQIPPKERDQIFNDYKNGKTRVLVSTNVLARGIDILQVMLVINYDVPLDGKNRPDPQTYLHRIGRSGRFGRKGIAINLIHDQKSLQQLNSISSILQKEITTFERAKIETLQKTLKEIQSEEQKLAEKGGTGLIDSDDEDDKPTTKKESNKN